MRICPGTRCTHLLEAAGKCRYRGPVWQQILLLTARLLVPAASGTMRRGCNVLVLEYKSLNSWIKNSYTLRRQEGVQSAIHHVAESETSMHWRGKIGGFCALSLVLFPNGSKTRQRTWNQGFLLGLRRRWVGGWLLLLWKVCGSLCDRTGQTTMKNKSPICL